MQLDLFDVLYEDFKFDKPIRTITSFSGIGFQEMGMDLAEIPFKVLNTVEIDKFAMLSYAAIHTNYLDIRDTYEFPDKEVMVEYLQERNIGVNINTWKQTITHSTNIETVKDFYLAAVLNNNLGDISKVKGKDLEKDIDLFTYSFPCTDLSKAGQQKGLDGTRSGLVYEVLRLLHELHEVDNLPKVLIMENVVDLIQVNFIDEWNKIALEIEEMGYTNFTQVLNAKDYGVAQNRQRVFMVSILGNWNYNFPRPIDLEYRLKDYLEDEVDESLYLSDRKIAQYRGWNSQGRPLKNARGQDSVIPTITARSQGDDHGQTILLHGGENTINVDRKTNEPRTLNPKVDGKQPSLQDRIYDSEHTAVAVTPSFHPSYTEPKKDYIPIPEATKQGYALAKDGDGIYINRPHQKRGVVQDGMIQTLKANNRDVGVVVSGLYLHDSERFVKEPLEGLSRTLKANKHDSAALIEDVKQSLRIRKLTPVETGRLMGMNDTQISKQQSVVSNSQAYKQHGNGIVAQVIGMIIGMMWYEDENELNEVVERNSHTWLEKESK